MTYSVGGWTSHFNCPFWPVVFLIYLLSGVFSIHMFTNYYLCHKDIILYILKIQCQFNTGRIFTNSNFYAKPRVKLYFKIFICLCQTEIDTNHVCYVASH